MNRVVKSSFQPLRHRKDVQTSFIKSYKTIIRTFWKFYVKALAEVNKLNLLSYPIFFTSFLSIKTLKQLAAEEIGRFRQAFRVLLSDCFTDDVISVEGRLEPMIELQAQVLRILKSVGMPTTPHYLKISIIEIQNVAKF